MTISIALATYNGEQYIEEQLASFAAQTRLPDELVVTDDGSRDETLSRIEQFAVTAPFEVRIHRNAENLGFAKNFMKAISLCSGDLIFLSDQDDVWFPDKIETVERVADEDRRTQVFMNDAVVTLEDLTPTTFTALGQIRSAGQSDSYFVKGCCAAIRSAFLTYILPVPSAYGRHGHDTWINDVAIGLDRRLIIELPLQFSRRHGANASVSAVSGSTRQVSKAAVLWQQAKASVNRKGGQTLELYEATTHALIERVGSLLAQEHDDSMRKDLMRFKRNLEGRLEAIEARSRVIRKRRLERIAPAARMLFKGQYSYFSGAKSAWRDILMG